jgi:hypothetical protein
MRAYSKEKVFSSPGTEVAGTSLIEELTNA